MSNSVPINSPIALRLPEFPESELPPEVRAALEGLYTSIWNLVRAFQEQCGVGGWPSDVWSQLSPAQTLLGANANRLYARASEPILSNAVVNLWNDAGTLKVRNANATNNSRFASGFCSTAGGVATNAFGEFILGTGVLSIPGTTPGTRYFLSTTNGQMTATAPAAAGNIRQHLAVGLGGNLLYYFNGGDFVQL